MEDTYLFEVSWEICNKVGGIYTVIKSKTADVKANFGKYYAIGPYFPDKNASEFSEGETPEDFRKEFNALEREGIVCHYGKWLTDIDVDTILIDFSRFTSRKNEIKGELWSQYQIDSLYTSYFDFDEPVIWAYAAGKLLEALSKSRKVIVHCHEWLAGAALLYLRSRKAKAATVFTTHATVLGRSLSGAGTDIYNPAITADLSRPDYKISILPKHQLEEKAAKNAHVFTTVSPITAMEAEKFLSKKPDFLLLNGLNIGKFPTFEEAAIKHSLFKAKIKEFLLYYFFPYYEFDIDNALIYFLASRYEFRTKGIDLFIHALGELNKKLTEEKSQKSVVTFILVPSSNATTVRHDVAESRTIFMDVKESVTDEHDKLMERLLTSVIARRTVCDETYLLGERLLSEIRRKLLRFKKTGTPPLSTHAINNEENDEIIKALNAAGLANSRENKVKVIFYPTYLTGADNLLDLGYYEAMQGSHLGVFPSIYEPWGYTTVEAAALGVPSVTTDLSGFGRYIGEESKSQKFPGIYVMKRLGKSDENAGNELTKIMHDFTKLSTQDRVKNKIEAKRIASLTDWKFMIKNYTKAYALAAKKAGL